MHHSSFPQRHSQFSARYGMFPQRHRLLAMPHSSISLLHRRFSARYGSFLSAAGCSLCTIEYLLMLVAKLQLNSDIPTNSDKIFIVFPVFLFLPLPSRRAHLHKIYDHLCENYDHLHAAGGYLHENYDDLHENYDDLHKNYDHLHENYNHLCVLAVSLRHTPSLLRPEGTSSDSRAGQGRDDRSPNLFRRNLGGLTIMP